jgi:hypothetical protein
MPFGWLRSIIQTHADSIFSYGNIIFIYAFLLTSTTFSGTQPGRKTNV